MRTFLVMLVDAILLGPTAGVAPTDDRDGIFGGGGDGAIGVADDERDAVEHGCDADTIATDPGDGIADDCEGPPAAE